MADLKAFVCPTKIPVGNLHPIESFSQLSDKEKAYATYLSLAAWACGPIIFDQVSAESRKIHNLLAALFKPFVDGRITQEAFQAALKPADAEAFTLICEYAGYFWAQCGNYAGFGDTKFVPRCTPQQLRAVLGAAAAMPQFQDAGLLGLLDACQERMYSLDDPRERTLGFAPASTTAYYTPDVTKDDVAVIDKLLLSQQLMKENTCVYKHPEGFYEVSLASVETSFGPNEYPALPQRPAHAPAAAASLKYVGSVRLHGGDADVYLSKGRNARELATAVHWLGKARGVAASEGQAQMISSLVEHYTTGNCDMHKTYSEAWVRDLNPSVETYQGFIETYRDPAGVRAEFEGFVACVDKHRSEVLHKLVQSAGEIIPLLPYGADLERSTFNPPSYNALTILCYPCNGMPIGINIPNYDDIRTKIGFKNVSLVNVMNARTSKAEDLYFIPPQFRTLVDRHSKTVLDIHVSLHELYGHGSGKLLSKADVEKGTLLDPLALLEGRKVPLTTYYKEGETYPGVFGSMSSAFEECRAECTAIFLCSFPRVMEIYGLAPTNPEDKAMPYRDLVFTSFYDMMRAGLLALSFYDPSRQAWLQAHSQARFCILRACLIWAPKAVVLKEVVENGAKTLELVIDRSRLDDVIYAARKLLLHLNVYKASANFATANEFFVAMTALDERWVSYRAIAETLKKPRSINLQAMIAKTDAGHTLVSASAKAEVTCFDVAKCICNNILVSASV